MLIQVFIPPLCHIREYLLTVCLQSAQLSLHSSQFPSLLLSHEQQNIVKVLLLWAPGNQ